MKKSRIQKRLLMYKLGMIGSLVFFAMGITCVYLAQHPSTANRWLHYFGFHYQLKHPEEK